MASLLPPEEHDQEHLDYFNYLARRHAATNSDGGRLTMQQVSTIIAFLRQPVEVTPEGLKKRRSACEQVYLPAETAIGGL